MSDFDILSLAKQHLQDLADGKFGEELIASYFSKDVTQKELPNKLNINGSTSDYNELIERSKKIRHIVMQQTFTVLHEHLAGNTVILEVLWKGIFTIPIGNTQPGGTINAHCALIMEFENG